MTILKKSCNNFYLYITKEGMEMVLPKKRELKKYGETILLFVVLCFILNKTTGNTDLKFIDFRLLYVVIISCLYGLKQR